MQKKIVLYYTLLKEKHIVLPRVFQANAPAPSDLS